MKESEVAKIANSVTISATKMDEFGKFSLKTNLPIFHQQLKNALQDEETRDIILKLTLVERKDSTYGEDEKEIEFQWNVEDVTETEIILKTTFTEPFKVSKDTDIDYHSISVEVLETIFFTSKGGASYEKELIYSRVPPQIPEDDAVYETILKVAEVTA